MARSKSIIEHPTFSSTSMVSERSTTDIDSAPRSGSGYHEKEVVDNDSMAGNVVRHGSRLGPPEKEKCDAWQISPTGNDSEDAGDETTSTSTISSTSHRIPMHHSTTCDSSHISNNEVLLPSILLKQHHQSPFLEESDDDGWRIRSRYLHCLGMDNELQHHDHPKPNKVTRSEWCSSPHVVDCSASSMASALSCPCPCCNDSVASNVDAATAAATASPPCALRPSPTTFAWLKDDHGKEDETLVLSEALRKEKIHNKESSSSCGGDYGDDARYHVAPPVRPVKVVIKKNGKRTTALAKKKKDDAGSSFYQAASSLPTPPTSKTSFDPCVRVREIPSHHQLSERIRNTIWMLPREYVECITKNTIEFMAEGYEPDRVLEESDFLERDGKLVHPVCEMLEDPENIVLKGVYYGKRPTELKKEATTPKKK